MNAIIRGPLELSIEQELLQSGLNAAQREKAQETVDALAAAMDEHREAARHITSDTLLNDAGKKVHAAQLATTTDSRITRIGSNRIESLDRRIAELEVLVKPQDPANDPMIELLKQQEIRALVSVHPDFSDELKLTAFYIGLSVDGSNDLAMRAIENAPIPLITDPSILESGKATRGARQSEESSRTLKQLKSVRSTISATVNAYRSELNLIDLTLERVAAGTAD